MAILNNCCFCFSVKTGCFIIGYFYLVLHILGELTGIGIAIYGAVSKSRVVPLDAGLPSVNSTEATKDENVGNMLIIIGVVIIVVSAIGLTIATLFVVGLHKNKRGYLKPFVECVVLALALVPASLIAIWSLKRVAYNDIFLRVAIIITSSFAIHVNMFKVVKSHYDTMNDTPAAVVTVPMPGY